MDFLNIKKLFSSFLPKKQKNHILKKIKRTEFKKSLDANFLQKSTKGLSNTKNM